MRKSPSRFCPLLLPPIGWAVSAFFVLAVACGVGLAQEAAQEAVAEAAEEEADAEAEAEAVDPFEVPEGTTEELVQYIDGLLRMQPDGRDMESVFAFHRERSAALVEAADQVLADDPTDADRALAVQAKLIALSVRVQMGEEEVVKDLEAMVAELKEQGRDELARTAETIVLRTQLATLAGSSREQAVQLIRKIADFVSSGPVGPEQAQLAMHLAQVAERFPDPELAVQVTRDMGAALSDSEDEMVGQIGKMLEATARRLGLVGSEMQVYGTTLEGEPLNWKSYRGKVVLVDFWATWCGPCLEEIPNMLALYDAYHDRGFDIVGISVDENPQALLSFVEQHELPWTIVADQNQEAAGERPPVSEYYGISAIPTMILVGKDGKVLSLGARGPVLHQQLEDLLGPVEVEAEGEAEEEAEESPAATE